MGTRGLQGPANFLSKAQIVSVSGFAGRVVDTATQL